jgi:hypothetical protein
MQGVVPQEVEDDFGISVQALVPLQALIMQAVELQVMPVPRQAPPEQASLYVQRLLSSQDGLVFQLQAGFSVQ